MICTAAIEFLISYKEQEGRALGSYCQANDSDLKLFLHQVSGHHCPEKVNKQID